MEHRYAIYVEFKYTDTTILINQVIVIMQLICQKKNGCEEEDDNDIDTDIICIKGGIVLFLFIK